MPCRGLRRTGQWTDALGAELSLSNSRSCGRPCIATGGSRQQLMLRRSALRAACTAVLAPAVPRRRRRAGRDAPVRRREAQRSWPRAQRASTSDLARLFERSAQRVASCAPGQDREHRRVVGEADRRTEASRPVLRRLRRHPSHARTAGVEVQQSAGFRLSIDEARPTPRIRSPSRPAWPRSRPARSPAAPAPPRCARPAAASASPPSGCRSS
jgi:hypothetical protein